MFWVKYTEIILSNGDSHVIQDDYENVFERMFTDSGELYLFRKIGDGYINVSHIVEIRDYKER